jgi:hypothetical protein
MSEIEFVCDKYNYNIEQALQVSDVYVTLGMIKNTLNNNIEAKAQKILSKL